MTKHHTGGPIRVAALVVLCVFGLVFVNACGGSRPTSTPDRSEGRLDALTETFSAQESVDFIGRPFPPSATELHMTGESALDTIVIARFDAPREDVVAWLADLGITEPLEPGYSPFHSSGPPLPEAADWWAPPAAGDLGSDFSGVHQQIGATYYNIVLRELENGVVRVHLQVYNT